MNWKYKQVNHRSQTALATVIVPWILPLTLLILWQYTASLELVSPKLFPSPLKVLNTAWRLIANGQLGEHLLISLARASIGLLIGGGLGFVLGILNGIFTRSYLFFDTTIQMIRNIPHLALVPLVIIWIGIGEEAKVFLVALGVLFPIYVNTFHGVRSVPRNYIEMGRVYGLTPGQIFRHIIFPGALPSIFVGIRYGLGVMWLTLIVAETTATTKGIGFLAMNAREFMQADIIILSIVLYALLGKAADSVTTLLEKNSLRWIETQRKPRVKGGRHERATIGD